MMAIGFKPTICEMLQKADAWGSIPCIRRRRCLYGINKDGYIGMGLKLIAMFLFAPERICLLTPFRMLKCLCAHTGCARGRKI